MIEHEDPGVGVLLGRPDVGAQLADHDDLGQRQRTTTERVVELDAAPPAAP